MTQVSNLGKWTVSFTEMGKTSGRYRIWGPDCEFCFSFVNLRGSPHIQLEMSTDSWRQKSGVYRGETWAEDMNLVGI